MPRTLMLFNSFQFALFFAALLPIYFLTPVRWRWLLLLAASYYFYMCWKAEYVLLIVASTAIDYVAGLLMGRRPTRRARLPLLVLSLGVNLGLLFAFKYLDFFGDSARALLAPFSLATYVPSFQVLLPVGISFYTFQTLSYTIDVYRGARPPERHLGIFALYVAFFPQLVAGPIERSTRLIPQLRRGQLEQPRLPDLDRVTSGLRLALWGLFKKVVIADRVALLVDQVYNHPQGYHGLPLIIATFFFAVQIYCDFSGYSDIAIGTARVLGYDLMQNFRRPYAAVSVSDFWRRWHISLSQWFRDYLYISLGGNRVRVSRHYLNIMIVFLLSGLWHGANWTFVIWGTLHGLYLLGSIVSTPLRARAARALALERVPRLHRLLRITATFCLVCFAWIFFRANSLDDAFYIAAHLLDGLGAQLGQLSSYRWYVNMLGPFNLGMLRFDFVVALATIALLWGVQAAQQRPHLIDRFERAAALIRWPTYYALVLLIVFFGVDQSNQFIYFQF